MASNLICGNCGARVAQGLQWCTLCHADLRPPPTPEELAALPPPPLPPPAGAPPQSPPPNGPSVIPPPPHAGGNVPPMSQTSGPLPPPVAPPPLAAGDLSASRPEASQDVEQWGVLLAAAESQQKSRMGRALSSRGTRIGVAVAGAVGVMVLLTLLGTVLGALFS